MEKRIVIIGAGPTGLGAAYRLKRIGYRNWVIYERESHVGGLCASFRDSAGFTWDIGGHVLFSGNARYNAIFEELMGGDYLSHQRKAYVRVYDRWIPYPFQNNIRRLPKEFLLECLIGLIEARAKRSAPKDFRGWIHSRFGDGIAKHFMLPYNRKVWAYPLERMGIDWISERVSPVDLKRVLENVVHDRDDAGWGPNNLFNFPKSGGTQEFSRRAAARVKDELRLEHELVAVDSTKKTVRFRNGAKDSYDFLINTSPLDRLCAVVRPAQAALRGLSRGLKHNGVYIVGIGLKGRCPEDKCWVYSPEDSTPFFRVTYFANYSPNNVPTGSPHWSLMCETSFSEHKPVGKARIVEETLKGLRNCGILKGDDRDSIVSTWMTEAEYAYPIPTLRKNERIGRLTACLERGGIYSRGRFGGWRYEIGNMDHSFMQGLELVERLLLGRKEKVWGVAEAMRSTSRTPKPAERLS